jgi:nucleoside-diphosphate-sugar epimerase
LQTHDLVFKNAFLVSTFMQLCNSSIFSTMPALKGNTMTDTVLILGARGRFGLAAARAFAAAGWKVLGQTRCGAVTPDIDGVQWLGIDLTDAAALLAAARGAAVVVHALNPAYTSKAWQTQAPGMLDAAIKVAHALNATLMLPGNVYNYGRSMPAVLREDTAQSAHTIMGQARMAMEAQLQRSGVRSVVIRAGNFFGAGRGTWFDTAMVKDLRKGVFCHPGPSDVATAWAYLPDLARAFVAVAQRRAQLPVFEVLHFAGHTLAAQDWVQVLQPLARAQAWIKPGAALKLSSLPWPLIRLGALVLPTWAALLEMRYLWQMPHALANGKLSALIGSEPHTPLVDAARDALLDLGMLPPPAVVAIGSS